METVLTRRDSGVMTLTMNRPDRLNAVNEDMYRSLISVLQAADSDPSVRVIVLAGAGRAFCVGADLKAHSAGERNSTDRSEYVDLGQRVCEQIQVMDKPVIAAVHGYALGAGAEMAISADFFIMGAGAKIGFPEISIGTFVGGGVTHRLPRLIGLRRATEVLIFGEQFSGEQAFEWGLASAVVDNDLVFDEASRWAQQLETKAPISMAKLKSQLRHDVSLKEALANEAAELLAIMNTQDWAEGIAAFAARRTPIFRGE